VEHQHKGLKKFYDASKSVKLHNDVRALELIIGSHRPVHWKLSTPSLALPRQIWGSNDSPKSYTIQDSKVYLTFDGMPESIAPFYTLVILLVANTNAL
jgi:hypothetical protein